MIIMNWLPTRRNFKGEDIVSIVISIVSSKIVGLGDGVPTCLPPPPPQQTANLIILYLSYFLGNQAIVATAYIEAEPGNCIIDKAQCIEFDF